MLNNQKEIENAFELIKRICWLYNTLEYLNFNFDN